MNKSDILGHDAPHRPKNNGTFSVTPLAGGVHTAAGTGQTRDSPMFVCATREAWRVGVLVTHGEGREGRRRGSVLVRITVCGFVCGSS